MKRMKESSTLSRRDVDATTSSREAFYERDVKSDQRSRR
jgi:hypothetical protein